MIGKLVHFMPCSTEQCMEGVKAAGIDHFLKAKLPKCARCGG